MDLMTIVLLAVFPILGTFAYAGLRGAPWVPTRQASLASFQRLARLQPGERFYDFGCGDGRLVRLAAHAGARATGFELSLLPYVLAKIRVGRRGDVRFRDFWKQDCSDADCVYAFLVPDQYPKLKEKCERELRPGARICLYVWPMEGWEPTAVETIPSYPPLYQYIMR